MTETDYKKMTRKELERLLTQKQCRFAQELDKGCDAAEAAINAGYQRKNAQKTASELLNDEKISAYRRVCAREEYEALGINEQMIAKRLMMLYDRCMQERPVLVWSTEQRAMVPSGQTKVDCDSAIKVLKLMGQTLGMFKKDPVPETPEIRVESLENYLRRLDEEEKAQKAQKSST